MTFFCSSLHCFVIFFFSFLFLAHCGQFKSEFAYSPCDIALCLKNLAGKNNLKMTVIFNGKILKMHFKNLLIG